MDSEEEFEQPQFKQKSVNFQIRKEQLLPKKPIFLNAPRTISSSSFFNLSKKDSFPIKLPKRSNSAAVLTVDLPELPEEHTNTQIKVDDVIKKVYQLDSKTKKHIETTTRLLLQNKNVLLTDNLDPSIFVCISSILQVYKDKHALFIVPSSNILSWIRTFLGETSAKWPEGRTEQLNALSKLRSGSTQVLMCINTNTDNLILDHFDYIFVIKSELSLRTFQHIQSFKGPILYHQTPGYNVEPPQHVERISGEFSFNTVPEIVSVPDYVRGISKVLKDCKELRTIIICPTKKVCSEVIARNSSSVSHYTNQDPMEGSAYASTTAVLYTNSNFDSFIFAGFPPSLELLMSACVVGRKVVVMLNIPIAQQMQRFSHNGGVDRSVVADVFKKIVWGDKNYRHVGDIVSISQKELDITPEGEATLFTALGKHGVATRLPFDAETVTIKVKTFIDEMTSPLFRAVTQGASNKRGMSTFKVIQLCHDAKISPTQMATDLMRVQNLGAIEVTYSGKVTMLAVSRQFDDESYNETLNQLANEIQAVEDNQHDNFNALFTIINLPELARKFYESNYDKKSLGKIMAIPYESVDEEKVKKLIKSRNVMWTPRAVARILSGISSPHFTLDEWKLCGLWGSQASCKFTDLMRCAQDLLTRTIPVE